MTRMRMGQSPAGHKYFATVAVMLRMAASCARDVVGRAGDKMLPFTITDGDGGGGEGGSFEKGISILGGASGVVVCGHP